MKKLFGVFAAGAMTVVILASCHDPSPPTEDAHEDPVVTVEHGGNGALTPECQALVDKSEQFLDEALELSQLEGAVDGIINDAKHAIVAGDIVGLSATEVKMLDTGRDMSPIFRSAGAYSIHLPELKAACKASVTQGG